MIRLAILICLVGTFASSLTLDLPGRPVVKINRSGELGAVLIPSAAWSGSEIPGQVITGQISTRVYQSDITSPPSAFLAIIGEQLSNEGYEVDLACVDRLCGGFEFRFALPVADPPDMFVDLSNYAFISARKGEDTGIIILASQSPLKTHIQITEVKPRGAKSVSVKAGSVPQVTQITGDLSRSLEENGFFILSDLKFKVGSSSLAGNEFQTLTDLADYLSANPHRTIALVGHTDATGSLDGNIALSKKRARSVRTLLLDSFGIAGKRVGAEGMGYLSPVAPNTTEVGREKNRRVEVIITSSE